MHGGTLPKFLPAWAGTLKHSMPWIPHSQQASLLQRTVPPQCAWQLCFCAVSKFNAYSDWAWGISLFNQCTSAPQQESSLTSHFSTLTRLTAKSDLATTQTYNNNSTLLSAAISQDTQLTSLVPNNGGNWQAEKSIRHSSPSLCLCLSVILTHPRSNGSGWWLPNGCQLNGEALSGVSLPVVPVCPSTVRHVTQEQDSPVNSA